MPKVLRNQSSNKCADFYGVNYSLHLGFAPSPFSLVVVFELNFKVFSFSFGFWTKSSKGFSLVLVLELKLVLNLVSIRTRTKLKLLY